MHREPEPSNDEWKTWQRIRETLERYRLTGARTFHKTGLSVDIEGLASRSQRSVAVRGSIDALPIQETRDSLSYCSEIPALMHVCGHDMHASIAMGTALAFHRMRENLSDKVCVVSQPAEEAEPFGDRSVAEEGLLLGFDAAVSFHVKTDGPAAMHGARAGAATRSADQFALKLIETITHGARPHAGVDAITMARAFVNEVQNCREKRRLTMAQSSRLALSQAARRRTSFVLASDDWDEQCRAESRPG